MTTVKILGDKYVRNGISAAISSFVPDMSADIYYEVIRLIEGKLLFLPENLERLRVSLSESGTIYPGKPSIEENLRLLLAENLTDLLQGSALAAQTYAYQLYLLVSTQYHSK